VQVSNSDDDDEVLYLPKQLGNALDLTVTFPGYAWTMLDPSYAASCPAAVIPPSKWAQLFTALGVQHFLPLRQQTLQLSWRELLTNPRFEAWKGAVQQGQIGPDVLYVIQDWHLPALETLLRGRKSEEVSVKRKQQLEALCGVVSGMWPDWRVAGQLEATYAITTVKKRQSDPPAAASSSSATSSVLGSRKLAASGAAASSGSCSNSTALSAAAGSWQPGSSKLPSSLLLCLQETPWLLASSGAPHAPCDLFLPLHDAKQLFQDKVLYLACEGVMPQEMAVQLGVTCDVSLGTILRVLTSWSQAAAAAAERSEAAAAATAAAAEGMPADPGTNGASGKVDSSAAAAAAAAAAARVGGESVSGGCVASLADMRLIYNRIGDLIGDADLPEDGFATLDTWQQQQRQQGVGQAGSAAAAAGVVSRLQACKAFSERQLVWLPDAAEVRAAAAKAAAAARQCAAGDGYYEEPGWSNSSSSRGPGRWQQQQRQQQKAAHQASRAWPDHATAAAAAAVPEDVMYDADLMHSLQRVRMRGRFYSPEQLRFYDEAQVLEVISLSMTAKSGSAAAAAAAAAVGSESEQLQQQDAAAAADAAAHCLRVAGLYYGGLQELFVRQLQRFKYNSWIPLIGACTASWLSSSCTYHGTAALLSLMSYTVASTSTLGLFLVYAGRAARP
jgi:hypothetical protein